jgi:hypothetical protein
MIATYNQPMPTMQSLKIATDRVRELYLHKDVDAPAFVAAASSLVRLGKRLFVIADDALCLSLFADDETLGASMALLPGTLPADAKARKAQKPDFESLLYLPAFGAHPYGALLAMGSGSSAKRRRAALIALNDQALPDGRVEILDLSPLFVAIEEKIGLPNIEGMAIWRDECCLLQRGNQHAHNALIRLPLVQLRNAITTGVTPAFADQIRIQTIDLGTLDGVRLTWTDADVYADQLFVSAAAERTDNAIDDGACLGSAIAMLDWQGNVRACFHLDGTDKVEGIVVHTANASNAELVMDLVTDNDDPKLPAWHLRVALPNIAS